MEHILGLLLILASDPAIDRVANEGRSLHNPDCGYVCVFPESVRSHVAVEVVAGVRFARSPTTVELRGAE
jgi:hypothetical protein